jgi:ADP-ribose pyrophosphatase
MVNTGARSLTKQAAGENRQSSIKGDSMSRRITLPKRANNVFQGKIFGVWQWEQRLYDGSTATFELISRADTVNVVGVLPDKKILLTRDEQPDREPVLTPAGGRIEDGETPEQAAKREFLEETGYAIGTLAPWHTYHPFHKIAWRVHAFIGQDLQKRGQPQQSPGEKIELQTYTFDEFLSLGSNPNLRDTQLRILLLEAQLDPRKNQVLRSLLYDKT